MKNCLVSLACLMAAASALAQVTVQDPWVRATVPHQTATGAFMKLTAPKDMSLIQASSPVAGVVQVHQMTTDGNVMKMRAVPSIALPAGKAVALKPGGYHIMLLDLKREIKVGESVPLTLVFEGAAGTRESALVQAAARPLNASQE